MASYGIRDNRSRHRRKLSLRILAVVGDHAVQMYSINLLAYPGPTRALLRSRGTTSSRILRDLECRTTPDQVVLWMANRLRIAGNSPRGDGKVASERGAIGDEPGLNLVHGDAECHPSRRPCQQPFTEVRRAVRIGVQIPQHEPRSVTGGRVVAVQRPIQPLLAAFPVYRYDIKPDLFADSAGERCIDGTFGRHGDRPHDSVPKHQRQLFFTPGCRAWKHGFAHRHPRFQQKSDLRVGGGDFHPCAVAVRAQQ